MSNSIIINRKKHPSILADHRIDPVTKQLLKVGDEVCVCAVCKTVYLKEVWKNTKRGQCCKQTKTLPYIPNIEYGVKETPPVIEKSYKNHFIFFLLTTFLFLGLVLYWYNIYNNEHGQKEYLQRRADALNNEISNEKTNREKFKEQTKILNSELTNLKSNLSNIKNTVERLNFRVGKNRRSKEGNYDNGYFMFLDIQHPVKLHHLYVRPQKKGNVTIELYSIDNEFIESKSFSLNKSQKWNKLNLNFKITTVGRYYLKEVGDTGLWYDLKDINYELYRNDVIKIVGCSNDINTYNDRRYYQYFYDIHYSLLTE
ncbi:hypothetical protein [uncultured Kordia sp.]|uniref:hypothetical protein n=1 Tax=uncultured Kordia sp. TaxID=507699 RepID=UPI00261DFCB7|nr:hypothetical protein [uncultured Kordia sp.]